MKQKLFSQFQKLSNNHVALFITLAYSAILVYSQREWPSSFIQTMWGLGFILSYITYLIYKKTDWLLALSFFYFTVPQIPKIVAAAKFWPDFEAPAIIAFQTTISQGVLYFILIFLFTLYNKKQKLTENVFYYFALIDIIFMLAKYFNHSSTGSWFLFNNPAIDASFIAVMLPFLIKRNLFFVPIAIVTCLLTYSSSGVAGAGIAMACYFWSWNKFKIKWYLILIPIVIAGVGYKMQGRVMVMDSSGRYYVWGLMISYWKNYCNIWHWFLGTGTGTTAIYAPTLQIIDTIKLNIKDPHIEGFFWLHNDWLQVLIENGILGVVIGAGVIFRAIYKLRNRPALFASLITYCFMAIIQMPLRHIIYTMLGAWLIIQANLRGEPDNKVCGLDF